MPPLFLMEEEYEGRLEVSLHSSNGTIRGCSIVATGKVRLFDFVSRACENIFSARTKPDDWRVLDFDPQLKILEVKQIAGEPLIIPKEKEPKNPAYFDHTMPPSATEEFNLPVPWWKQP